MCMVVATITIVIVSVSLYVYELRQAREQLENQYRLMASTIIAPLCAPRVEFGYDEETREVLETIMANKDLLGVCIYDSFGEPFVHTARDEGRLANFPPTLSEVRDGFDGSELRLLQPIVSMGEPVGMLLLVVYPSEARARAASYGIVVFGVLVAALIVAFIVSSRLAKFLSTPIITLADTTRSIADEANYSLRAEKTTHDELGKLIDSFNQMLTIIQARDQQLEQHREELEDQVARRTEDLRRLSVAVEQSPNGIVITDKDGTVEYANERCYEITGYSPEDTSIDGGVRLTLGAMDPDRVAGVRRALAAGTSWEGEFENRRKDGAPYWELLTLSPLQADHGESDHFVWQKQNVTSRKGAEIALRESEERYALAAKGANDGLWDWDLRNDRIFYSDRWASMLGFHAEELTNSPEEWFNRVHEDDIVSVRSEIDRHLQGDTPLFELEFRMRHRDGTWRWILNRGVAVIDDSETANRFAGSQTDITDRKLAETKLYYEASHDSLTNLPNRGLFTERLASAIERSQRNSSSLYAVLFLDLDRFKVINDSLGHIVGDKLLIQVSERLSQCVRTIDMIARLGGDEFAILLEDINDEKFAIVIAERIEESLARPFILDEHEVFTSASVGIAYGTQGYKRAEDILRDSDSAMYRAKSAGKSQYALFDSELHDQAVRRLELENDMRRALDNNEFELYYQPIVDIASEHTIGFEALVRWNHPTKGLVSPIEFIPVSEETGLIVPLSWKLMEQACSQTRKWFEDYGVFTDLSISVNVSSKQFMLNDFVPRFQELLERYRVPQKWLKLEITETVIIENPTSVMHTLQELRALDVELCIDDFGTGYSSLSYLHQLPFDIVKIDRAFIKELTSNHETFEIVQAIISLCSNLGLRNTAEGVEEEAEFDLLKNLMCEYAQGYLISKPLPVGEVAAFLESSGRFGIASKQV